MKWRSAVVASVLAVFGFAASANAATIEGTLNWNGGVQVDADTVDWLPQGGGTGTVAVTAPQTGYFNAFGGGIDGLAGFPSVTATSMDLQSPTAFPVANFITGFTSTIAGNLDPQYSDLSLTLLGLQPGAGSPCVGGEAVGVSCSIGFFTVTQLAGALTISLNGTAQAIDPSFGNSLAGTIGFSTQGILTGSTGNAISTVAGVLAEIALPTGFISASYSGTATFPPEVTNVPEPATLLTLGVGSALLAARRRRKGAKASA